MFDLVRELVYRILWVTALNFWEPEQQHRLGTALIESDFSEKDLGLLVDNVVTLSSEEN